MSQGVKADGTLSLTEYGHKSTSLCPMIKISQIMAVAEKIARLYRPEKIILFGSYGYGTPTPDSDVDLLVVMPFEGKSQLKSLEILSIVNPNFPVDLLTRTPQHVRYRLEAHDFFMQEVIQKGKVLYERTNP